MVGSASQMDLTPCWHVPVSCARQVRLPFFPSQTPEQHWSSRWQGSPNSKQPNSFGCAFLTFFLCLCLRFGNLGESRQSQREPGGAEASQDVPAGWHVGK